MGLGGESGSFSDLLNSTAFRLLIIIRTNRAKFIRAERRNAATEDNRRKRPLVDNVNTAIALAFFPVVVLCFFILPAGEEHAEP